MTGLTFPGKKVLAGLAVGGLLLAGTIGTALADKNPPAGGPANYYQQFTERLATLLGKQPDEVRSAITQVQGQFIDEGVTAGKIPADRAQALKDRAASGEGPFFGGHPGHGRGMGPGREGHPGDGVMGEVVKVDGQTLTIKTPDGSEKTVLLTATTKIFKGRDLADATALQVGTRLAAHGKADAQGVVTADEVHTMDGQPGPGHGQRGEHHGPTGTSPRGNN